jgi:multicomponent Na+:H+ antiporter subunit D
MSADLAVSTTHVVVAPMLAALVTAVATLATRRHDRLQRTLSLLGIGAYAVGVAVLADRVLSGGTLTYQLSAWPAPFGISLVADALAAFMLSLAALVTVALLVFSVVYVD